MSARATQPGKGPADPAEARARCRICGGPTRLRFSLPLAYSLTGNYYECTSCGFLHSDHLDDASALERVYADPDPDGDPGAAWRQFCVANRIRQLSFTGMLGIPRRPVKALDVGASSGFVPAFVAHQLGWDAVGYEPYARPAYSPRLHSASWDAVAAQGPYQFVSATEVIEHLRDPLPELRRIASVMDGRRSFLYVTTGAYDPARCDERWPYLATHAAQHCSFYSRRALRHVADAVGAPLLLQLGREAEWLFVRGDPGFIERARLRTTATVLRALTPRFNRVG